ncbi:MAG: membrane-bound lytic murein transglycosylase F [Porticoccus sp.]|jgi:membrane-bound lytic murein transglycosylase F
MRGFYFHFKRTTKCIALCVLLFVFALTLSTSRAPTTLEEVLSNNELRILTLMGSTTYFKNAKGKGGFEYLLAKEFAKTLDVELKVTAMSSLSGALLAVGGPRGHLAAAGLTITPERHEKIRFSNPYYHVTQTLIYRNGTKRPKNIGDLNGGRLLVIPNSSHSERLSKLKLKHPGLQWEEVEGLEMLDLMSQVHSGKADYAIVDSTSYLVDRSIYPNARAAFDVSEPQPVAWAFSLHGDNSLIDTANTFLRNFRESGGLELLKNASLIQTKGFNLAGSQLFLRRINTRLPKYEKMLNAIAKEYDIDRHLLAAIAYQESHWNDKATSPTGVRGLMMLTLPTAKEMGVSDRLDPKQSLTGGVQYFLKTKSRLPKSITGKDRTLFALAAYNVGMGHLEDARVLTDRDKRNPNLWEEVKKSLPLLQQKKYFTTVRYGYARGQEPVGYVQNILHFQAILKWHSLEAQRRSEREQDFDFPNSSDWNPSSLLSL